MEKNIVLFTTTSLTFGLLFWIFAGHNLGFDVSSGVNGESSYWYSEEFTFQDKTLITVLFSIIAGLLILFLKKMFTLSAKLTKNS